MFTFFTSTGVFGIQNTLFSRIQSIDLIYSKGLIADLSNLNINITAIGLNMVISREAYFLAMNYIEDTNLVEDYDLSQKVLNNGLKLINVLEPETTIKTKTKSSIKDFFEQRNRWMYGFKKISLNLKSLFVSIYMFYPLTLILIIFKYNYLWLILIIVVSLRFLLFTRYSKRISKSDFNKYFLLYEIVMNVLYFFIFFHSFISRDISWKNRKYKI